MISTGRKFIFDQWWVATMPGLAIFIVSLGFNLLGDAARPARPASEERNDRTPCRHRKPARDLCHRRRGVERCAACPSALAAKSWGSSAKAVRARA
jgi:hypothetical protein